MKLTLVTAAAASATLTLLAPAARADDVQQCFFTRDIENFTVTPDEHTVYLRVSGNRYYRLDLPNQCPNLSFRDAIQLQSVSGSRVCNAIEINLKVRSAGVRVPCMVTGLHQMTPADVAMLPKRLKP
jgi:hypothetical protein